MSTLGNPIPANPVFGAFGVILLIVQVHPPTLVTTLTGLTGELWKNIQFRSPMEESQPRALTSFTTTTGPSVIVKSRHHPYRASIRKTYHSLRMISHSKGCMEGMRRMRMSRLRCMHRQVSSVL